MHHLPHVPIDRLKGSSLTECDKCKSYEHLVSCPFVEAAKLEEIKLKEHTLSDSNDCQYYWYTELHTHTHTHTCTVGMFYFINALCPHKRYHL